MPRKPDPANQENPIRKLRKEQLKITQDQFGELLGMSGNDIRNIENGRQKISGAILHRIIALAGAEYSTRSKIWKVPLSPKKCDPDTLTAWRQAAKPSNKQKRDDHEALSSRLAALLAYSKPREYNAVFMKLSELLANCLAEHPSPEAKEIFEKSKPKMTIRRILKKDSILGTPTLVDDEEVSVAQETGLPTIPFLFPQSQILEVAREYEDFPKAEELLPEDADGSL